MAQDDWLGLDSGTTGDDWLGLDQPVAAPEPEPSQPSVFNRLTSGAADAFGQGLRDTSANIGITFDTWRGDTDDAMAAVTQANQNSGRTPDRDAFMSAVEDTESDGNLWSAMKDVGGAVVEQPVGALQEVIAQLPNSATAMAGMWAGAKAGAAAGALTGPAAPAAVPVLAFVGGVVGAMFGTSLVETGGITREKAQDGILTEDELSESTRQGATKSAVIGLVDRATMGVTGWMFSTAGRAAERAAFDTMSDLGVDIASREAVEQALNNPMVASAVKGAIEDAISLSNTAIQRTGRAGAAMGLESFSEGAGEYWGSIAAGLPADMREAVMEGFLSMPQSALETMWSQGRSKTTILDDFGLIDTPAAEAGVDLANMRQRDLDAEAAAAAAEARAQGGDTLDALLAEQEVMMNGEASGAAIFRPDQFDPITISQGKGEFVPGMQSPASIDPATGMPAEGRGDWVSGQRRRMETEQAIEQGEQEIAQALGQRDQQRQQQAMDQSWRGIPNQTPIEGFGGSDLVPGADQTPGSFGRTGQPQQTNVLSADLEGTGRVLVGDGTQDELYRRRLAEALEQEDSGMARVRDERDFRQMGMGMPERETVADPQDYQPGPPARQQADQAQIDELEKLYEDTRKQMPEREKGGQKVANVDMDVLQYIVAKGGVNLAEGKARGFDSGDTKKQIGGFNRVFTSKGITFDGMAESMSEDGFFQGRDYTANELEDMVRRSLGGELIFSPRSNKAGLTAAVKNNLEAIEAAIDDIKGRRDEDVTDQPKGRAWQSEPDPMRQMVYTLTEAEAIGVPQRDIDRILDTAGTPEQADTWLKQEIEREKQFRGFWFGSETAGPGSAEGSEASLGSARPQEEGRGQEASPAERLIAAQARRNQAEADKDVNAMIDAGDEASSALIEGIQAEMNAGRMPVIQDGSLYHAIHPSTSRPGKLQITTYNDTGALSDTTVDDMDGVQRELNASKSRVMPADEANETMNRIGRAEAEYQQRRKAFELSQETEQQRTDRERTQRDTQERESAAATEAEQRARADADLGDFSLTGSDRQADANPNQVDLLDGGTDAAIPDGGPRSPADAQTDEASGSTAGPADVGNTLPIRGDSAASEGAAGTAPADGEAVSGSDAAADRQPALDGPTYSTPLTTKDVEWVKLGTPSSGVQYSGRVSPEGRPTSYGTVIDKGAEYGRSRFETSDGETFAKLSDAKKHEMAGVNAGLERDGYLKTASQPAPNRPRSEAPEHLAVGVDQRELSQIVDEFKEAHDDMRENGVHHLFDHPTKSEVVRLANKAKVYTEQYGWMTPAEAKARIKEWKDRAAEQGRDKESRRENSDKVVLSFFDLTGKWSQPWEEAGYQVWRFDIQNDPEMGDVNSFSTEFFNDWFGSFDGNDIYAILAACPCTDFASSGARHFAAKDADGRTVASVNLVHQTLRAIEYFRPAVWALENPVGRIEKLGGLPPWRLSFDPNHLGETYTKKTLIWGRFNADLPIAPVDPVEGSKMHSQYGGSSIATKNARSATPEGFSYGFFMANNAIDNPVMALANKFDRLDRDLIGRALDAGVTEQDITTAVEDFYYIDLDDDAANQAIQDLIDGSAEQEYQITQRDVDAAHRLTAQEIERKIDGLKGVEVQKRAKRLLSLYGVKIPVGKEKIKAAVTDFSVIPPKAAAAEFGAGLSDSVTKALDAEVEGRIGEPGDGGLYSIEARKGAYNPNQADLFGEIEATKNDDPYKKTEVRPGTTERQRDTGRSALRDFFRWLEAAHRRAGESGRDGGGAVSLLGASIYKNFQAGRPNQLIGRKIGSPADLAALAQVYRDPRFETLRVFYTDKDGNIIAEQAASTRLPASVAFESSFMGDITETMTNSGAEGVYLLHNHPSGLSEPSPADVKITEALGRTFGDRLKAHVVIDTNEYSVINGRGGVTTTTDKTLNSVDFSKKPEKPHWALGEKIDTPRQLAGLGRNVSDKDSVVIISTKAGSGGVNLVASIPMSLLESGKPLAPKQKQRAFVAAMRRLSRAAGSGGYMFAVLPESADINRSYQWMDRYFQDVVDSRGDHVIQVSDSKSIDDVISVRPVDRDGAVSWEKKRAPVREDAGKYGDLELAEATNDGVQFRTGQPVTFNYRHNTGSATSQMGMPKKGDRFKRDFEPSGRYVNAAGRAEVSSEEAAQGLTGGTLTFNNPLVIPNDSFGWKESLSKQYGGKTGKALSQALIDDGIDGVVTVENVRGNPYASEIVDLTTFDPSIAKYSIAQESNRLSALHNLSAENLIFADEMGGIAVPSIAVVRDGMGMDGFGEITLIGTQDLANPDSVPVYDADAYTSRFPQPEYGKAKSKDAQALVDQIKPYADKYEARGESVYTTWDGLVNNPKPQDTLRHWLHRSNAAKAWFLDETRGDKTLPRRRDVRVPDGADFPGVVEFFKALPDSFYDKRSDSAEAKQARRDLAGILRKEYESKYTGRDSDLVDVLMDKMVDAEGEMNFGTFDRMMQAQRDVGKTQVDEYAIEKTLNRKIKGKEAEFKSWAENKLMPLYGAPKLKLGGKKVPYTMENIVEAMTRGPIHGSERTFTFGPGNARAAAATRFSELQSMRNAAEGSLKTEAEVSEARKETEAKLEEFRNAVLPYYAYSSTWEALDDSMAALAKYATNRLRAGGERAMRQGLSSMDFKGVPSDVIRLGIEAGSAMMDAPVPYFEAKPQRAVALNEFAGAVIPKNADAKVIEVLERNGVAFAKYDTKNPASRVKATNRLRAQLAKDGKSTLFSQGEKIANAHTSESLTDSMNRAFPGVFAALEKAGLARIVSSDQIPAGVDTAESVSSKGRVLAYVQDGAVTFVADNIAKGHNVKGLMLHEIGVHLRQLGQGDSEFQSILKQFEGLARIPGSKAAMALSRVPEGTPAHLRTEEGLGYLVENNATVPLAKRLTDWFRAQLKKWLGGLKGLDRTRMMKWANGLSESDLITMATQAVKSAPAAARQTSAREAMASAPRDQWYKSALSENIGGIRQMAGKDGRIGAKQAKDWVAAGTKKGLFKSDEVEWVGLNEWLDLQEGKVSVDDIQAFVDANGVQVEDVTLGTTANRFEEQDRLEEMSEQELETEIENVLGDDATDWDLRPGSVDRDLAITNLLDEFEKQNNPQPPKYADYQLPGGENYRELLLTLPGKKNNPVDSGKSAATMLFERDMVEKYGGDQNHWVSPFASVYNKLTPAEVDKYEMYVREDRNAAQTRALKQDRANNYRSAHWDQPNILAHVRVDDRTDADGNRVLFVNEIQSDWAQDGRKKGFRGQRASDLAVANEMGIWRVRDASGQIVALDGSFGYSTEAQARAAVTANTRDIGGLPDAPFVTKTENWTALALKRVIALAAEQGYDKVAIINGGQAADLYDLSKQVDSVYILKNKDGTYDISVQQDRPDGRGLADVLVEEFNVPLSRVEELVGKDLAEKAEAQTKSEAEYRGVDLKVGGEGMRGYYDKIVPTVLNKVLKKVGGEKAESITLPGTKSRDELAAMVYGQGETYRNLASEYKREIDSMFDDRERQQLGFTITDAMRQKVQEGLPLFSREPSPADYKPEYTRSYHIDDWARNVGLTPIQVDALAATGDQQRAHPEMAMLELQRALPGGVASHVAEHLGDISNRMSPMHSFDWSHGSANEKIASMLRTLNHPYGFEREANEALERNPHDPKAIDAAYKKYADTHRALPVFNEAQALARDAAVAFGEKKYKLAATKLTQLQGIIKTEAGYKQAMSQVSMGKDGAPAPLSGALERALPVGGGATGALFSLTESGQSRRDFLKRGAGLAVGAAVGGRIFNLGGDVGLGRAKPIPEAVLDARVPEAVEATLRSASGMQGGKALQDALRMIEQTGPAELRALAGQIAGLLPENAILEVSDRRMNAHGAVTLSSKAPQLTLYDSEGRNGMTFGTIMHEAMHLAVLGRYYTLSRGMAMGNYETLGMDRPAAEAALEQFSSLWREFRQASLNSGIDASWMKESRRTPDEFFVRALTDPDLQLYLSQKRYQGQTLIERFKSWIKATLFANTGTAPSWLDAALMGANDLMDAMGQDAADYRVAGAYEQFSRKDDSANEVLFSRAEKESPDSRENLNRRMREEHHGLWFKAKQQIRREFLPGGLLPKKVFDEKVKRDSKMGAVEMDVTKHVLAVEEAFKKDFGKSFEKRTKAQELMMRDGLAGNPSESMPERTAVALEAMRQYIDTYSKQYVDVLRNDAMRLLDGLEPDRRQSLMAQLQEGNLDDLSATEGQIAQKVMLMETIASNVGEYVHRSYRAFDDPMWPRAVPSAVLNNARDYLEGQYLERNEGGTEQEAIAAADRIIEGILKEGTAFDSLESYIRESKLGAKDLSLLKRRKQIAPEIRALLGEHTDPRVNFAKTATKMTRLIHNDAFLKRVREVGMGVFLFEDGTQPAGAWKTIAAEGNEAYAPLNGLKVSPEINQAFIDALGRENLDGLYRTVVRLNGAVKFGKTVLSPTTAMRNFMSAAFFTMANGHSNLGPAWKSLKTHLDKTGDNFDYLRELKELGVVYDTPYAEEMMRLLRDTDMEDRLLNNKMGLKHVLDKAQAFYRFGDDFWKVIGFENELVLMQEHYGLSRDEAKVKAAERIRNTYPTYSMTGRFVNKLRRFPLVGTFVSFPAEIIRTTFHIMQYAKEDMAKSKTLGARRVVGITLVAGFAYAAQQLSKGLLGVDDDEEEAVREQLPEWSKNSNLYFLSRDDGKLRYLDLSFLDPYNYWKRPLTAMVRDQPLKDSAYQAAAEMLAPFFGTDIAFGALAEIWNNKKSSGGQVYNKSETPWEQSKAIVDHLRKAVQPGAFANLERILQAAKGERSITGRTFSMEDELVALAGFRVSTLDPGISLKYRSFSVNDELRGATSIISRTVRDPNPVSDKKLRDAFDRATMVRQEAYKDLLRAIKAAEKSGLDKAAVARQLQAGGLSKRDAAMLANGKVPPKLSSKQYLLSSVRSAADTFGPEVQKEINRRRIQILRWEREQLRRQ